MFQPDSALEFDPEMEAYESEEFEFESPDYAGEFEEVFDEAELMELATGLLGVSNEQELNYFLGDVIKKAAGAIGKAVKSPVGKAIGGALKSVAGKALPLAGAALGGFVGGPIGAKIGSGVAKAAKGALGLEAEILSQEDLEFEGAKQFVRMAGDTVKKTLAAPPSAHPKAAAKAAVSKAVKTHAPGLAASHVATSTGSGLGGRWVRRGRNIVILNV